MARLFAQFQLQNLEPVQLCLLKKLNLQSERVSLPLHSHPRTHLLDAATVRVDPDGCEALVKAGNDLPTTMLLLAKIANERGHDYQPPAYFRSTDLANVKYMPPQLHTGTPRNSQTSGA